MNSHCPQAERDLLSHRNRRPRLGIPVVPRLPIPALPVVPVLLAVSLMLGLLAGSAFARIGDGRLLVRTVGSAGANTAAEIAVRPSAGPELIVPLATGRTEHTAGDLPPGTARVELRGPDGKVLSAAAVEIAPELTTVLIYDAAAGSFRVAPEHPDPFGNWEEWDRSALRVLPGMGSDGALSLDTRPVLPSDPVLDGVDLRRNAHLRPRAVGIEDDAALVQVPLGMVSPALNRPAAWIISGVADESLRLLAGDGLYGRVLGQASGKIRTGRGEAEAVFQAGRMGDAGPAGIANDDLPDNTLRALETRGRLGFSPAGRGLARASFYAFGQRRDHYLQEFKLDPTHNPREETADLVGTAGYDFRTGPAALALEGIYRRTFTETGDRIAFDLIENYSGAAPENSAANSDTLPLYWLGRSRSTPPHYYNEYEHDLTSTWTLRGEAKTPLAAGFRIGAQADWTKWRAYEHPNPIAAAQLGSYQQATYLGYNVLGDKHEDAPGHEAPAPKTAALYAAQKIAIGPAVIEAGLRWERFASGAKPLRNLAAPIASGTTIQAADFRSEPSHSGVDPRIGAYLGASPGTHLWADAGQTRENPPYEALYFSPNVLEEEAFLARTHSARRDFIFGNPALKPEIRRNAQAGFLQELGPRARLRASAYAAQVRDTWRAVRVPSSGDTLNFYENGGKRRERGIHLGLTVQPSARAELRVLYDLAKIETNAVEPALLYQQLLLPGTVSAGSLSETSPVRPVWFDQGGQPEWFPSFFDRRHRISAAALTRVVGFGRSDVKENLQLAATVRMASGAPYTPLYAYPAGLMPGGSPAGNALSPGTPTGPINSERMPWTFQVDLGLRNDLRLLGGDLSLLFEVRNLAGKKNVRQVYGATGKANDDGWLSTAAGRAYAAAHGGNAFVAAYRDRLDNPLNYEEGRTLRASIAYGF